MHKTAWIGLVALLAACDTNSGAPEYEELSEAPGLGSLDGGERETQVELARIEFDDGTEITFTYDPESGEYMVSERGDLNVSGGPYLPEDGIDSMVETFIGLTPEGTPVPELLLGEPTVVEHGFSAVAAASLDGREVADGPLYLALPTPEPTEATGYDCSRDAWSPWFTHPNRTSSNDYGPGRSTSTSSVTFYSSVHAGGKRRYTHGMIAHCGWSSAPRMRWYYKNAFGNYKKQLDVTLESSGHYYSSYTGGSDRYRKVVNSCTETNSGYCNYHYDGYFSG